MKSQTNKIPIEYLKLSFKKDTNNLSINNNLVCRIIIDGRETDYIFDELAFKVSSEKDGVYPIVVCGCGVISCGGMYVSTHIEGDDIIWDKFWHGQCFGTPDEDDQLKAFSFSKNEAKGLMLKPVLRFNLKEYIRLADELMVLISAISSVEYKEKECWITDLLEQYRSGDTSRI